MGMIKAGKVVWWVGEKPRQSVALFARQVSVRPGVNSIPGNRNPRASPGTEVVYVCAGVWGGVRKPRYDAFWDFSDSLVCAESGQHGRLKFLHDSPVLWIFWKNISKNMRDGKR